MSCEDCGLCAHSSPSGIPGAGNKESDIMIINSYAGDDDEDKGRATMSSTLLEFLEKHRINPEDIYYTNAIKCRTPKGTKFKVGEIKKCKVYLDKEIRKVKPKFVLLIGAQALKATVGGAITTLNGVTIKEEGISYVPTMSPGIVYRDPGKAPFVEQALGNFINLIHGTERQLPDLNIKILRNLNQVKAAFEEIQDKEYKAFSYDIETTGLDRFEDEITLLGFGNDEVQYIIPLEVKYSPLKGKRILQRAMVQTTVRLLNTHLYTRVAGNGKFDNLFLKHHFRVKPKLTFDVVLGSHILNENTPNGVKENAIVECNTLDWDIDTDLKKGNVKNKADYNKYLNYLGYDIYYEYQLYRIFKEEIKKDKSLYKLFYHLYMPVIRAYEEVEEKGVYVNKSKFKEVRQYLESDLAKIERRLARYKKGVNWSSCQQVAKFLYSDLKLPILETTASGAPSTSESTLLRLRDKHKAVELILKHRGVKIQISHFIDGWINRMHNSRLHPNFKLLTVTGRTSCTDPNLQQVPRDPTIRNLISTTKGRSFVEIDFSQAELRIATLVSGDTEMRRVYQTGGDIHTTTYELMMSEKVSDDKQIKKEQRKKAKAVNFGFIYGMGWRKFKEYARDTYGLKLSDRESQDYRTKFFQIYNKIPDWHKRQRRIVQALGQVRNPIGRLRRLPDIYSSDKMKRAEAERQSINSPVQGFGSDLTLLGLAEITKYAIVKHSQGLNKKRFNCIGTVHDSILFEVDDDYLEEFLPRAKYLMEFPKALKSIFKFKSPIPILVDVAVGKSWGNGIELDFSEGKWRNQLKEYLTSQR
jgi:uracil-DNA glycosylase family 4